ncbi:MAG: Bax inhibitor-1/YccA family protein [Chitinophagales bacterium]|jgi:uncharacterized YccA/Bax inhibitor family protein|nr:Bax inhibitor-1/YccA family protein [Chitinophagales bacterium]
MALFSRTSNPTLSDSRFEQYVGIEVSRSEQMTIEGTINKTALLLAIIVGITVFMFYRVISTGDMSLVSIAMPMGAIGGFITAIVIIFKNTWANYLAPVYAIFEGFFIGAISIYFEASYPGIAFQAAGLTFGTMGALLFLYRSGIIRATEQFKAGIVAATMGIALFYLLTFILSIFGIQMPYIHQNGLIGIGFSLFVVVIAALNLVLDFDFIERGSEQGLPKHMEWYGAFGLVVTLIWLYVEILRLLSKLQSRD